MAFRSHWSPKTSSSPPITSCMTDSGNQRPNAYPAIDVTTASSVRAADTPARADRQPRVKPMAMTMVVASTISTKQAPKLVAISTHFAAFTNSPFPHASARNSCHSRKPRGAGQGSATWANRPT
jgi:hypothetical protein